MTKKKPVFIVTVSVVLISLITLTLTLILILKVEKPSDTMPQDEIIMICGYDNYAGKPTNNGFFLDTSGNLYTYDLRNSSYTCQYSSNEELSWVDELEIIKQYTQPYQTIDMATVRKIYDNGMQISDTEPEITQIGYDGGNYRALFHNPITDELVICWSEGDTQVALKDFHASRLLSVYDKKIGLHNHNDSGRCVLSTSSMTFVETFACDTVDKNEKFVVFNPDRLKELESQHGFSIDIIWDDMKDLPPDQYVYLVEFITTDKPQLAPRATAVFYDRHAFTFTVSESMKTNTNAYFSKGTEKDGEGVCYVSIYPNDSLLFTRDTYLDFDGNEWTVLR